MSKLLIAASVALGTYYVVNDMVPIGQPLKVGTEQIQRIEDKNAGVICYLATSSFTAKVLAISCVKVK